MKKIILSLGLLFSLSANSATYYFRGCTDNNWNLAGNWSTSSGACPAVSPAIPGTADTAYFDSTSPNVTVNAAEAVKILDFTANATSNYAGTITMTNAITVGGATTNGGVTLSSAMTISGSSNLNINSSTGFTMKSNGKTWPNTLQFTTTSATATLSDNWTVGNLTFSSATQTINGNSIFINGNLTMSAFSAGTTTLVMQGTGTWSGSQNCQNSLTFNSASGTITISGSVNWGGASKVLTYTAGTMVTTGSTLNILNSSVTLNTGGMNWNNISDQSGTQTWTLNSNLNVKGNLAFGDTTQTKTVNGNTVNLGGNLTIASLTAGVIGGTTNFKFTNATINGEVFSGTGTFTMGATTSGYFKSPIEVASNATFSGVIALGGNLTFTSGSPTLTGTTISFVANTPTLSVNTSGIALNAITQSVTALTFAGSNDFSFASYSNSTAGSTLTLTSGRTYTATSSFTMIGQTANHNSVLASSTTDAFLVLNYGDTMEVSYTDATHINSSNGMTVWDFGSTNNLSNTVNWNSFTQPATVGATF